MGRLTTDKPVKEMNMLELAFNCCYAENGHAMYRDFDNEGSGMELARLLYKNHLNEDLPSDDEELDEILCDALQNGLDTTEGLIAVFYRNLWAMAELRERLKHYEDLEEQGLLIRLPCKVGDTVYYIDDGEIYWDKATSIDIRKENGEYIFCIGYMDYKEDDFGKIAFLTKAEAEQALERRKNENTKR